ncbi:MAG: bifunctional precorrin-2 dehydrogenase/sirohydrochlorin ferrochelatase [Desulfarculus sp.]|nr:bifunctional precorrin-2 dehydrogenase/sirohydrochlorin ferrochelatase [Desulfarculus sp.]
MQYYPAFLDLRGRLAVVVGGGQVAGRKVASLLEAGAWVRLVAPELNPATAALLPHAQVEHLARAFAPADLEGAWLVISATNLEELNRAVAAEAENRRVFVNVVDVPELCSFIVPASLRRGDLCLAVSTGGAGPAVARRLREGLEGQYGPEWGDYLRLMRAARQWVKAQGRPAEANRPLFFALADSDLLRRLAAGDLAGVDEVLRGILGPECGLAALGWRQEQPAAEAQP